MANLFTVVGILVETNTSITKQEGSIEASIPIR